MENIINNLFQKIIDINSNAEEKLEKVINDYNNYFQDYLNSLIIKEEIKDKIWKKNEKIITNVKNSLEKNKIYMIKEIGNNDTPLIRNAIIDSIFESLNKDYPFEREYYEKMSNLYIKQGFLNYLFQAASFFIEQPKQNKQNKQDALIDSTLHNILDNYNNERINNLDVEKIKLTKSYSQKILSYHFSHNESKEKEFKEIASYLNEEKNSELDNKYSGEWKEFRKSLKDNINKLNEIIGINMDIKPSSYHL